LLKLWHVRGGCLGGPLNVENMYVARKTIKKFIDDAKEKGLETGGRRKLQL